MTNNGKRRPVDGVTPGSAPFDLTEESSEEAGLPGLAYQPLHFDPREFLQYVESQDLTEEQAVALLKVIWEIVVAFVDIGFGLSPVQQALVDRSRRDGESASQTDPVVLSSKDSFSNIASNRTAGRKESEPAAPEDS